MNRTELQAKVTAAIRAIERLEAACQNPDMKSWDKTAIHIEELSRIKAELQNKYSPLILELPATKPDAEAQLSKDDRAALAAYNRYEKQIAAYEVFIARKTSYHSNIGKTGFLIPELDREVSSELPYPKKYEEDAEFAKALKSFEQHKATYGNLKNMLQRATPDVIRGLLEDFINSYRTLRLAVERERNRIQAENATKEALWKELNEISSPLVKIHGINLQKDEPYKTLGVKAGLIYAQVGNAERNLALKEIVNQLKENLERVNQERETNLIDLNKRIKEQAETFTHLYEEMANLLESADIDDTIIADVKDRFVSEYNKKIDSDTDEVEFKIRKLETLKELRTEFDRVIIDERQYISSGVIQAINVIAEKFAKHLNALDSQLENRGIKFGDKEQALIEQMKKTFNVNPAYKEVVSPDALKRILDDVQNKEKEFDILWPKVVEVVKQGQQARIVELKETLIPQQQETFQHFYSDICSKLVAYGLWPENEEENSFIAIEQQFTRQCQTACPTDITLARQIDFYQDKQKTLIEITNQLTAEILDIQEAICTAMVDKIDEVANGVEQKQREILAYIKTHNLKFDPEGAEAIKAMQSAAIERIAQQARGSKTPSMLEHALQEATKKEKEFNALLPAVKQAIALSEEARITELKDNIIPKQQEAFQHFYSDIQEKLTGYGLWELNKYKFVEIQEYFNEEYEAVPQRGSHSMTIGFYQTKQSTLNEYINELKQEIVSMQEAICTAMVKVVDTIADRVEQEQRNIKAQIQEDFAFTFEEQALLEKMAACTVERVAKAARDGKSPEILEPVLTKASDKEKELQEILPAIKKAIERCREVNIAELKAAITNQERVFKDIFNKVHANLGSYGLDQRAVSEISEAFDNEFNAINEDEIDPIEFYKNKLQALKTIATGLDRAVVQAEHDIVANLKHSIHSLVEEIETRHREALAAKLNPEYEYQFDENEQALVDEFRTPVPRTYQEWTTQAQLEEHLQALMIQREGLADKSEKINNILSLHNDILSGVYDNFFIDMNDADKDQATAMLAMLGRYLAVKNEKLKDYITSIGFEYICKQPAIEAIEELVQDNPDYSDMLEQLQFIKILSAKQIDAVKYLKSSSTVEVINLLHEKGLDQFITKELLDNAELIKALGLINKYSSVEINEALMTNKGIDINKMAIVINKIDDFVTSYVCEKPAKEELARFRQASIPALLTDKTCEEKKQTLCTLAKKNFEHQHSTPRALADLLQCITGAFLIIMPIRYFAYHTHPFFSMAETNRESLVKREILPELASDNNKDAPENDQGLPQVEPPK